MGWIFIFYVPQERQRNVHEAMKELLYVPFKFETGGTQVVYYAAEEYEHRKTHR